MCHSPLEDYSRVFSSLNKPAASRMCENSMKRSCTFMILFRISDCKKTHTNLTKRFCMYLSLMVSHDEMQLEMYRCTNSVGRSTAVVRRFTTSIECRLMSMLTRTEK